MKTLKLFLLIIGMALANNVLSQRRQIPKFLSIEECGHNTTKYIQWNFYDSDRYRGKELLVDTLFNDTRKGGLPVKSYYMQLDGSDCIYLHLFFESKEWVEKNIRKRKFLAATVILRRGLRENDKFEENRILYAKLKAIGIKQFHDIDQRFIDLMKGIKVDYTLVKTNASIVWELDNWK